MAPRYFVICTVLAAGCSTPAMPTSTPPPLDWQPQLDQPIRQLQEDLAATTQQQPMNYISSNLAFVLDAKLYLLFERYIRQLPGAELDKAIQEQRIWLQQRKQATDRAYAEYDGGTLASFSGNQAFIEVTKSRIDEINSRLGSPATMPVP